MKLTYAYFLDASSTRPFPDGTSDALGTYLKTKFHNSLSSPVESLSA
jgi:hypothetical protein